MILMKFSFFRKLFSEFFFFRIRIMTRIRISLWNLLEKVILYILKISTKLGVAPQSFCENQYSVQDQDHDFTLDFNTRPTFYVQKIPTKFWLDPLTPSKFIVSTSKVHVRTARQPDKQTDEYFFFLFCRLRYTKHENLSTAENFFFFHTCDYNTFSFYILRMWWENKNVIVLSGAVFKKSYRIFFLKKTNNRISNFWIILLNKMLLRLPLFFPKKLFDFASITYYFEVVCLRWSQAQAKTFAPNFKISRILRTLATLQRVLSLFLWQWERRFRRSLASCLLSAPRHPKMWASTYRVTKYIDSA